MQLLLILALLLYGGKADGGKFLNEFRPVLETFGGEEIKSALKNAEELQQVISAFSASSDTRSGGKSEDFGNASEGAYNGSGSSSHSGGGSAADFYTSDSAMRNGGNGAGDGNADYRRDASRADRGASEPQNAQRGAGDRYALDPIAEIADKEVLYRLARYFAQHA